MSEPKYVNFGEAIVNYFSKCCDFKGVATRAEFWWAAELAILCLVVSGWFYIVRPIIWFATPSKLSHRFAIIQ